MDSRADRRPARTLRAGALVVISLATLGAATATPAAGAASPWIGAGATVGGLEGGCHHAAARTIVSKALPKAMAPKAPRRHLVAHDIDVPWGIAFLPHGGMLVSGRDSARVTLVHKNGTKKLARHMRHVVPNGDQGGEAGLLGLALAPKFASNHWVYAYMSTGHDNRIVRMRWHDHRLGKQHLVFKGLPRSLHHNGGRIAFGPDQMLYVTTGDAEVASRAQKPRALGGHILRMTPRGKPAPGNPFPHSVAYSWGHRNIEGLDWDRRGRLWATEFGEHAWDELNLIKAGHNYGWPIVEGMGSDPRFTNPKAVWHTEQAGPSGIAITRIKGHTVAYIGALTGERIWRVTLQGTRVIHRHGFYVGQLGRIRTTAMHGGDLYFTTSNTDGRATPRPHDDKLFRINLH
jgi:glucose/arabinose dehydrogenase